MEKIEKYKEIVRQIQMNIASTVPEDSNGGDDMVIQDDNGGHYLIFSNSWEGSKRNYGVYFHIGVTPKGMVWIHHDGTDLSIGQQLLDQGVAKEDLVPGWMAPIRRADAGFAVS